MKLTQVGTPQQKNHPKLEDGRHIKLRCDDCRTLLVDIWITSPDLDVQTPVQAKCGICEGFSEIHNIEGGFHQGIFDKSKVAIVDVKTENDKVLFITKKI